MVNFTPVAVGATGNPALFNDPLDELDAVIEDVKDGNYYGAPTTLTIASGIVEITGGYHTIAAEGAATEDDLDTINGGFIGQVIIIQPDTGDSIQLTEDGNIRTTDSGSLTLTGNVAMKLIFGGSNWNTITPSGLTSEVVPMTQVTTPVATVDITGIPAITGPLILVFGFRSDRSDTKSVLEVRINGAATTYQSMSRGDAIASVARNFDVNDMVLGNFSTALASMSAADSEPGELGVGIMLIHSGESQVLRWVEFAGHTTFDEAAGTRNSWKVGARHTLGVAAPLTRIQFDPLSGGVNITEGFYALYAAETQ